MSKKESHPLGIHRVVSGSGLPQATWQLDNSFDHLHDHEIWIDVKALNIDSASFREMSEGHKNIEYQITNTIIERGKMHNPNTGSGGMLIGTVCAIGSEIKTDLKIGDKIATLVSLSLTPLRIDEIYSINEKTHQVSVKAKAALFSSGTYAKLPDDLPESVALAVFDVCGAPTLTHNLKVPYGTTVIVGAGGKSGILAGYASKLEWPFPSRKLIGIDASQSAINEVHELGIFDELVVADISNPVETMDTVSKLTNGDMADLTVSCVNVPDTEMSCILSTKDGGKVLFFSMATNFQQAALGAESVGRDVQMFIGNGYTKGHAEFALDILKKHDGIRKLFQRRYG